MKCLETLRWLIIKKRQVWHMKLFSGFVFFLQNELHIQQQQQKITSQLTLHYACPLSRVSYVPKVHLQPRTIKLFPLTWGVQQRYHIPGRGSWTNKPLTLESLLSFTVISKSSSCEMSLGFSMISLEMPDKNKKQKTCQNEETEWCAA